MEVKINTRLFFMGLLGMILTAAVILPLSLEAFNTQAVEGIEQTARLIAAAWDSTPGGVDLSLYTDEDFRITLIAPEGDVLFESEDVDKPLGSHADRQEVVEAIKNGSSVSVRYSSTLRSNVCYCAVRLSDGNILRISRRTDAMSRLYDRTLSFAVLGGFGILLLSILISVVLTKQLVRPIINMGADLDGPGPEPPYPELEPFTDSLKRYKNSARLGERQRQEFTANVSHELKTPLTSISGYAEMLENGMCRPEDVPAFGGRIKREATRLITLVGDIIDLSRLDGAEKLEMAPVDLAALAQKTADGLALSAEKQGVTIACGGASACIMGNESVLDEMIYNLCDNAVRYNKPGGHVWLNTGSTGDGRAFVEVKDDGVGIPPEHQARVFERFYRVDKSHSRETGGTGLGLAIVKHASRLHSGEISRVSQPGSGTAVTVTFPEYIPPRA